MDTLFVDEAGQLSLANVLAVTGAGTNLVLVGDPLQLAQPSQAAHPPRAGVSSLEHILGDPWRIDAYGENVRFSSTGMSRELGSR